MGLARRVAVGIAVLCVGLLVAPSLRDLIERELIEIERLELPALVPPADHTDPDLVPALGPESAPCWLRAATHAICGRSSR